MVVDDHCHVVGGESVGLQNHLVVGEGGLHLAADDVGEGQRCVVGHEHPDHRGFGESGKLRAFLAGLPEAEPVVAGPGRLRGVLFLAQLRESLRGTPAVVGVPVGDQLLDERPVGFEPLRLPVGPELAALQRPLVGGEPEPGEGVVDLLLAARHEPVLVGVLDAQHERTTGLGGPSLVEQGHERGPDVRIAGRRGSDAGAGGSQLSHSGTKPNGPTTAGPNP